MVISWYISSIIQDFKGPVRYMIPAFFFSGCIVLAVSFLRRRKRAIRHRIALTLFIAYLLVIFYTVFLCREPGSRQEISLVPFETWGYSFQMHAMFIENIIMFIPFGIFLPLLFRKFKNSYLCVLTGFICSCSIEMIQHITQTGYLQVDYVMTNTAGILIGWMVWKAGKSIIRHFGY